MKYDQLQAHMSLHGWRPVQGIGYVALVSDTMGIGISTHDYAAIKQEFVWTFTPGGPIPLPYETCEWHDIALVKKTCLFSYMIDRALI